MLVDIVWIGAALIVGFLSFWTIILSLLVEWPFVKWILKTDWLKGLLATVLIHIISLIVGTILIGLIVILMGVWLTFLLNINEDVVLWVLAFFVTLLTIIGIEGLTLVLLCKTKQFKKTQLPQPPLSRIWLGITLANLLSVSITYLFIFFTMIHPMG